MHLIIFCDFNHLPSSYSKDQVLVGPKDFGPKEVPPFVQNEGLPSLTPSANPRECRILSCDDA